LLAVRHLHQVKVLRVVVAVEVLVAVVEAVQVLLVK
jgi:hypothetical protein